MKNETYQKIEHDVIHLRESMEILHDIVYEQQDHLDTIEDMIHHTKEDTKKGDLELTESNSNYTKFFGYIVGGMATLLYFIL